MRARNIKPGFFENEKLAEIDFAGRLLFQGLWLIADREGLLEDRPKRIKALIFPYDTVDVEPMLASLAAHGFIGRYAVGNTSYIHIPTFVKHQKVHPHEAASVIPKPNQCDDMVNQCNDMSPKCRSELLNAELLNDELLKEQEQYEPPQKAARPVRPPKPNLAEFDSFWQALPAESRRNVSKKKALEAYAKARGSTSHEQIMAGANAMAHQWANRPPGAFVSHPPMATTWLNQSRWEADYSMPQPEGKTLNGRFADFG